MDDKSSVLRSAESASTKKSGNSDLEGGISDARSAEESFVNSVTGNSSRMINAKGKGKLKKSLPIFLIVGLIFGAAILIFGAQTMMPFAVVNRLIEEFNTNGISSILRSDNLLDLQLSMSDGNIGLTETQISALEENGFKVGDYAGTKTLTYKKRNGKYQTVVSSGVLQAGAAPATAIQSDLPEGSSAAFMNPAVISVADAFKDSEFKNPYTTASKTWRAGNSGWFDQIAALSEEVHGYTRSRWFNYVGKGAQQVFKSLAKSMIDKLGDFSGEITDGTELGETVTDPETGAESTPENPVHSVTSTKITKAQASVAVAAKITNMAQVATSVGCAAVEALMSVQTLAHTYQRLQKLNLVSGYMEAVQKVQAGDGNDSPMDEYNNRLTTADEETHKTAMNAAGMGGLFSGTKISSSTDESVQAVNAENITFSENNGDLDAVSQLVASVAGSGVNLVRAFKTCNYAVGGLAFASAAFTATSLALTLAGPVGWATLVGSIGVKAVVRAIRRALIRGLITGLVSFFVPYFIKKVGKSLVDDMATEWLGEDLGNALVSGGNSLLSANHQTGGGSPASKTKLGYFKRQQEAILAAEAEYQRQIRSPFDISSQYTFLGSLVYQLVPMANSSGLGSIVKGMGNLVKSSMTDLLPSASAIAETEMIGMAEPGDCPLLESIGIQGDPYCNPLYITDSSTVNVANYINIWQDPAREDSVVAANGSYYGNVGSYSPEDIVETELAWGNIEETSEGVYTVKPESNLAKYATYCGQRVSGFGIADANIMESMRGTSSLAGGLLSMVPIAGDIMTMFKSAKDNDNMVWTTGEICVASESNPYWCEMSVHQRFIEDERWREGIGATSSNPIAAYFEDYYEKNPLDNSFEGILARYSGMTKDDVIATLDLIEGLNYIANYDPSERLAFGKAEEKEIFFEETEDNTDAFIALEPKFIAYFNLRNRIATV